MFINLHGFNSIKKLILTRKQEYHEPPKDTLVITFCDDLFCGDEYSIDFYDVVDLEIKGFGYVNNIFLSVYDISNRQLESIKYHVVDEEFHTLSFFCSGFSNQNDFFIK